MNLLKSVLIALSAAVLLIGCKNPSSSDSGASEGSGPQPEKSATTYAVVVGMENSLFAGSCPGAKLDSDRMRSLLSQYTDNLVLLQDKKATAVSIKNALKSAVENAELTIFYYSGHGGSEHFYFTGAEEIDGKDEFLCPYDTMLIDNDIWSIISKAKGRVLMIVDACHSKTIFRVPCFTLRNPKIRPLLAAKDANDSQFSMLCWSGCPDNTYSYGSSNGGMFTNAILRHFDTRKTYEYIWKEVSTDSNLLLSQAPQATEIGSGFTGKAIFK